MDSASPCASRQRAMSLVGYSDAHAEFQRTPNVGHDNDNIFTTSGTGRPVEFGGTPATPLFPVAPASSTWPGPPAAGESERAGPYDVILVPVRNASTGAM